MHIEIDEGLYLSPFHDGDIPLFLYYLNDPLITGNLVSIPEPYTQTEAYAFLNFNSTLLESYGLHLNYAIRNAEGTMLGAIGYSLYSEHYRKHSAQVGYYLGKEYWGYGIMTRALRKFVSWGQEQLLLSRISAPVFLHNIASERVLLKCGFKPEAYLRNYYIKNGALLDIRLYTLLK